MTFWDKKSEVEQEEQFLVLPLILSVMASLALILILVWMNIERTQLSYKLRSEQLLLDKHEESYAKVSLELETLASPQWLGDQAEKMGLEPAKPGQVRRMLNSSEKQEIKN